MAVFITDHYRDQITVADIAAAAHLHPKYATGLSRDRCGMTLRDYLVQQRLSQAQRLLATTDRNVVDIAFASGFGSVSQFYEVFTRVCCNPRRTSGRPKIDYAAETQDFALT